MNSPACFRFFIHGCKVEVNFYFFAFLCIVSFFDKSGMLLFGVLSATLHELGHLAAMLLLPRQAPSEVRLTPFGIKIKNAPLAEFMDGSIAVLAAGSAVNFLLSAVTLPFSPRLAAMNFVMGAMNLLPVEMLDGGGIARLLLCRMVSQRTAEQLVTALSLLVLSGMSLLGVYILFRTRYNFTLLGMSLWMLFSLLLRLTNNQ